MAKAPSPMARTWPRLRRKLLIGLVALIVAYAIAFGPFSTGPADEVEVACAKVHPGMPVAHVLAQAGAAQLSTTLNEQTLEIYRYGATASHCRIRHRSGLVSHVRFITGSAAP